jgi:nucleoside-diphosphate-sugar epimerase
MITGHYIALKDLTAMLHEITGHPGRITVIPAGPAQAIGRMADLIQHIVPGRIPPGHEGMWIAALQPHCDDSRTIKELGITPRDLRETLADTVRWLAAQGHISLTRAQEAA